MCLQDAYILIVSLLLVEHKTVYTMVSLDIFVINTTPLDNYSQLGCLSRFCKILREHRRFTNQRVKLRVS